MAAKITMPPSSCDILSKYTYSLYGELVGSPGVRPHKPCESLRRVRLGNLRPAPLVVKCRRHAPSKCGQQLDGALLLHFSR